MKKERFKKVLKAFKKRSFYVFIFCNLFATFLHFACNITSRIFSDLLNDFCSIFTSAFSAVATCLNNVGPVGNFSSLSDVSKLVLSFDMLAGRLEIFPMLLLFAPSQ